MYELMRRTKNTAVVQEDFFEHRHKLAHTSKNITKIHYTIVAKIITKYLYI